MTNRYIMMCALAAVFASGSAFAQKGQKGTITPVQMFLRAGKPLQVATKSIEVRPIAIAGSNASGQLVTQWYPMAMDNDWPNGLWSTVYDCAEISPAVLTTPPAPNGRPYENPAYGPAYMVPPNYMLTEPTPGARLYSGPTYKNPFTTNDMEISPLYAGFDVQRAALGWFWNPTTPTERMIVGISTAETFADMDAGLPPPPMGGPNNVSYGGFLSGITLDFGDNMGAGYAPGFYFANIDVSTGPTPLLWKLPVDGKGAHIMTILQSLTPNPTLASQAQPMLWITKQTNHGLPGGNPSKQDILAWDDDNGGPDPGNPGQYLNVPDGRHMTDPPGPPDIVELYDYTQPGTSPIPEPFGPMVGFYSNFGAYVPTNPADIQVQGGFYQGGTPASLRVKDGNFYRVLCDEINGDGILVINTPTPATTTDAISFMFTTQTTRRALSEVYEAFNFSTNTYDMMNFRTLPQTPSDVRVDLTLGAASYIGPGGVVRTRYRWIPQAELTEYDGWSHFLDRHTVFVKGVN